MFEKMIKKTHMIPHNISRDIVANGLSRKDLGPVEEVSKDSYHSHTLGGNKRYTLEIRGQSILVMGVEDSINGILIEEFMVHKLICSKRLLHCINNVKSIYQKIYLVPSMSYQSNADSGYGSGIIYATNNFNSTLDKENNTPRHDFIEVTTTIVNKRDDAVNNSDNDENNSQDSETTKEEMKFIAQCLCFLQFENEIKNTDPRKPSTFENDYYVLVNYLVEMEGISIKKKRKRSITATRKKRTGFIKYMWENTLKTKTNLVAFPTVNGGVFIAPDYGVMCEKDTGLLSMSWNTNPLTTDRFLLVPRAFTDCSGWEREYDEENTFDTNDDDDDDIEDNERDNIDFIIPNDLSTKAAEADVDNFRDKDEGVKDDTHSEDDEYDEV
jgi:hypothetical protein